MAAFSFFSRGGGEGAWGGEGYFDLAVSLELELGGRSIVLAMAR